MSELPAAPTPIVEPGSAEEPQAHPSRRKSKGPGGESMDLNMTSMIDVVFLLLVYFVITASFTVGEGVIIASLPQETGIGEKNDLTPPENELVILVTETGRNGYRITIKDHGVSPRDFPQLQSQLKTLQYNQDRGRNGSYKPDNPILIKPGNRVRWQHVVNTFNAAVAAEYTNISFSKADEQ